MSLTEAIAIWSTGIWVDLLERLDAEAERRSCYEPRNQEFVVDALARISVGMTASVAIAAAVRGVEASYRRYLRRRQWVLDGIAS